jgi:hypothetical protein
MSQRLCQGQRLLTALHGLGMVLLGSQETGRIWCIGSPLDTSRRTR